MEEWEIKLAWRQKVAAFWSISWPAWLVSFIPVTLLVNAASLEQAQARAGLAIITNQLAFFVTQWVLTYRIPRKRYRSFRVEVIRDSGERAKQFSAREARKVWLRILWPQLLFIVLYAFGVWWLDARSIGSLWVLLNFLIVGPVAVGMALTGTLFGIPTAGIRLAIHLTLEARQA